MAQRPPRAASRRGWAVVALVLFLVIDVALVAFALNRASGLGALGLDPAAQAAAAPTAVATPTPEPPAALVAPTRTLSALNATVAWRGDIGSCPASVAALESTTDGGATWDRYPLNPPTDMRSVFSIDVIDRSEVHVVGQSGDDCVTSVGRSYTSGLDWVESPEQARTAWYVDPVDPAIVRSPSKSGPLPCGPVVQVAAADNLTAAALCADRTVQRTADGGLTWDAAVPAPGVVALASGPDGYVLAAIGDEACDGVQVRTLPESGTDAAALGCLPARTTDLPAGSVAVSVATDAVWVWVDEAVRVSQDGGITW